MTNETHNQQCLNFDDVPKDVLLVDGHNLLFRFFFGMPRTIFDKNKMPCHGAFGFVSSILNYSKTYRPSSIVVCFDSNEAPERASVIESYKANRITKFEPGSEDNPFTQYQYILDCLAVLQISWLEIPGREADDLIGSYVGKAREKGFTSTIFSADRDFLQLIASDVRLYVKRGKIETVYTTEKVREDLGIHPSQYVDLRSLTGDKSDNLLGVPGVGNKIAASLLNRFHNLEEVYANLETLTPGLASSLRMNEERVFLNREVITINKAIDFHAPEFARFDTPDILHLTVRDIFTRAGIW